MRPPFETCQTVLQATGQAADSRMGISSLCAFQCDGQTLQYEMPGRNPTSKWSLVEGSQAAQALVVARRPLGLAAMGVQVASIRIDERVDERP